MFEEIFRKRFDASIIKPDASDGDVKEFVEKCKKHSDKIAAIAFNLHQVPLGAELLRDTGIDVVGMVAYPLNCLPTEIKVAQAEWAVKHGAKQIDMCMNFGVFLSGQFESVRKDIESVVNAVREKVKAVSVIPNTALLTDEQKLRACEIIREAGADCIKTNTGFGVVTEPGEVRFIRQRMGKTIKLMASGGVRNLKQALSMLEAGADRIATSTPFEIFDEFVATLKLAGGRRC